MSNTAEPYFPPMGYLVVKPISPVSLRAAREGTIKGYIEGVVYSPAPSGVLIREQEQVTAS